MKRPPPSRFRRHWKLAPDAVFLNHGSFGACLVPVLELQQELRRQMEAEPVQFLWRRYEERLEPSRSTLAKFVGARAADIVFVTNATTGVNAVIRSIKWRRGDEILTTNQDYNACHNVLVEAARASGARLVTASINLPVRSSAEVTETILSKVSSRTRLAMLDHITSNSAILFPVAQIIQELERRGVDTLVDGAHAPGMVALNLEALQPTYYTGNLHKWVCAPKGAAFLWVRPDKQAAMQPAVVSHGHNTHRADYSAFQDRFDWAGTFDPTAWFCVGEAIRRVGGLMPGGWRQIRQHNRQLASQARKLLCGMWGVEPVCPDNMLGSMAAIPLPMRFQGVPKSGKIDSEQLRLYDQFKIEVPFVRLAMGHRHLRISAHLHNCTEEYAYLGQALNAL